MLTKSLKISICMHEYICTYPLNYVDLEKLKEEAIIRKTLKPLEISNSK